MIQRRGRHGVAEPFVHRVTPQTALFARRQGAIYIRPARRDARRPDGVAATAGFAAFLNATDTAGQMMDVYGLSHSATPLDRFLLG